MGFADTYKDEGGGAYVGEDEKNELIENGVVFPIVGLYVHDHEKFGERYVATVVLEGEDGEAERQITFPMGSVESRDRMLAAYEKWLEAGEEPEEFYLERVGRSILVRTAASKAETKAKPAARKAPAKRAASKRSVSK